MNKPYSAPLPVNRRRFLKGLGVSVALPALQSLAPRSALAAEPLRVAATTETGAPLRTAFVFFPNGAIPDLWWPQGDEKNFSFRETLKPLESMRDSVQVMQGLDQVNANRGNDGGGDHARGNSVFLTGVRIKKSTTDIRAGVSIDQAIAQKVGHLTRFPSLELSCFTERRTGACDTGYSCAYQSNVAWKTPTNPMTPESNPRKVFERLFGEGSHGERTTNAKLRMMNRRSVLDFVRTDAQKMQKRLSQHDQDKLEQYLAGIREVEIRIQNMEKFGLPLDPDIATPAGVPTTHGEHIDIMYEMLLLAFQTDSTRVATMMMAYDGDNRSHQEIGIHEGHHQLSHHQNLPDRIAKVGRIDRWYVQKFATFLQRMDEIEDIDGKSLLHNSMILYGSGNADGNRHTHENLPILLAGHGGGTLKTGRFVKSGSKPATNLFLSMADRMGVPDLPRFGDSTGRLEDI
jgi:hypothetical protein